MTCWFNCAKEVLGVAKDAATLLAAVGALTYFGYKIVAGWLLLNLTVEIAAQRQSAAGEDDHLVVDVSLRKGKVDAARLVAVELRLTAPERADLAPAIRALDSTKRLRFPFGGPAHWAEYDNANPYLTLSTEESINLSEHFRVLPGVVYRVEVVVQGDRFRDRLLPSLAQWRATAIVLPAKHEASAT